MMQYQLLAILFLCGGISDVLAAGSCAQRAIIDPKDLFTTKIRGGWDAEPGRYPYVASLQRVQTHDHFCGGTLIAEDLVLTAAHCVHPEEATTTLFPHIRIGGTLVSDDPNAELFGACRTIIHSGYTPGQAYEGFDIAIIQLDKSSTKTPCRIDKVKGTLSTALGWGYSDHRRRQATFKLQEVELDIIQNRQCANYPIYRDEFHFQDSMMCATREGRDVCGGDSGGPLLELGEGCGENDFLVGLISFGLPCFDGNDYNTPSVYSRVDAFQEWINNIGKNEAFSYHRSDCQRDPPGPLKSTEFQEEGEGKIDDLPCSMDSNGCLTVEGVDMGTGAEAINDGHKDVFETAEECCDLCKRTAGCRTWTYFRLQEKWSPKGACWLRKVVGPASRCSICTTGLVQKDQLKQPDSSCGYILGMDLRGKDIRSVVVSRLEQCCEECKKDTRCKSATFTKDNGKCFLKDGIGTLRICAKCHSLINIDRVDRKKDDLDILFKLLPGPEQAAQNLRLTTIPGECRMTVGMDMKGGKLMGEMVFTPTSEDCCSLCKETEGCRSWTMVTVPTQFNDAGSCYLRSDIPEEIPCSGCTSGVVEGEGVSALANSVCGILEGVNLENNDIGGGGVVTASPKACCDLCQENERCKSWTRVKTDGKCFLKDAAVPVMKLCPACDSGIYLDRASKDEIAPLNLVFSSCKGVN